MRDNLFTNGALLKWHMQLASYINHLHNVIVQVHVIAPALPKVYHVTPKGLIYLHAKFIKIASVI